MSSEPPQATPPVAVHKDDLTSRLTDRLGSAVLEKFLILLTNVACSTQIVLGGGTVAAFGV